MQEEYYLDLIIKRLIEIYRDGNHPDLSEIHSPLSKDMTIHQLKIRLRKLRDDGNIIEIPNHTGENPTSFAYQIAPNGRILASKGGYTCVRKKENFKERLDNFIRITSITISVIALFISVLEYRNNLEKENEILELKQRVKELESFNSK